MTTPHDKLPKPYQEAVESASAEAHVKMQAQYDAKNPVALKSLLANGVKLHPFPRDLLRAANKAAFELYDAEAAKNPAFKKLYEPWKKFREQQYEWFVSRLVRVVRRVREIADRRNVPVPAGGPCAWRGPAGGGCHAARPRKPSRRVRIASGSSTKPGPPIIQPSKA
jgi:hypothetical protein